MTVFTVRTMDAGEIVHEVWCGEDARRMGLVRKIGHKQFMVRQTLVFATLKAAVAEVTRFYQEGVVKP